MTRNVWTAMIVRCCLVCAAFAASTSITRAQSYYYYYPSSPAQAPVASMSPTTTPVYYYVPSGHQNSAAWSNYTPQYYYQSTYSATPTYVAPQAPQYYQPVYAQPVAQTAEATQAVQMTTAGTPVVQTSYVVQTAAQPATTTEGAVEQPAATTESAAQPAAATSAGDPYGFLSWLNSTRASYGLPAVGYDPNLEGWASANNMEQASRGMGHYVMGPARRQNSAMGGYPGVESMWMSSPAHRAALLDPTIRWIGIAGYGAYWTFNAY